MNTTLVLIGFIPIAAAVWTTIKFPPFGTTLPAALCYFAGALCIIGGTVNQW